MGESNGRLPHKGNTRGDAQSSEGIALTSLHPETLRLPDSSVTGVSVEMAILDVLSPTRNKSLNHVAKSWKSDYRTSSGLGLHLLPKREMLPAKDKNKRRLLRSQAPLN